MTTTFDVLRRPLVTEKSNYQSGKLLQYTFEIAPEANRTMVKDAIEIMYEVSVVRVNIINTAAKRSRRAKSRRLLVRKSGMKKAIVTLAAGQTLSIFEGVQ